MKLKSFVLFALLYSINLSASIAPFLSERNTLDLKEWTFLKGDRFNAQSVSFNDTKWEKISVPHTFNMDAITEVGYYQGLAWYRTKIKGDAFAKNNRVFIRFEGVGQEAEVYINGKKAGKHAGSYGAFCFELTKDWNFNTENILAVKVDNTTRYNIIPVSNFLFNLYGGIYRPVALFSTPEVNISPLHHASTGVFVETKSISEEKATIEVRSHISNKSKKALNITYSITNKNGIEVASESKTANNKVDTCLIEIPSPILWNGKVNPYLYTISVRINEDSIADKVIQNFGVRKFKVDANSGFILNGEKYKINGVCRHQEWQQVASALTNEHHTTDMNLIEEIGATGLRLSHYQHADYMYQLADERGIIVWAEIPFVHKWSGREQGNAKNQLTELILQNYNHPSICFWGLWNEVRAYKNQNAPCVQLTKDLNNLAHKLDPTRPTTSASDRPNSDPMNLISDLQAWNKYFGWYYGTYNDLGDWADEMHANNPDLKISVSEYGAGANILHQDSTRCEKPKGDYFPEQEQALCHEKSWKALKDKKYLWGTFLWNMFDFSVNGWYRGGVDYLNHKGLISFDRKIKKDAFYFYKANWSDEPVVHITEERNNQRTQATVDVKVYTNLEKLTLRVNDKKIATKALASDIHIALFSSVNLKIGINNIEVSGKQDNKIFKHEVVWVLE